MKSIEPSTGTSKRPRGEASTTALASGDQPAAEEVHVDHIAAMDLVGDDDTVDPTVTPPFSLRAIIESFMTTQVAHG